MLALVHAVKRLLWIRKHAKYFVSTAYIAKHFNCTYFYAQETCHSGTINICQLIAVNFCFQSPSQLLEEDIGQVQALPFVTSLLLARMEMSSYRVKNAVEPELIDQDDGKPDTQERIEFVHSLQWVEIFGYIYGIWDSVNSWAAEDFDATRTVVEERCLRYKLWRIVAC